MRHAYLWLIIIVTAPLSIPTIPLWVIRTVFVAIKYLANMCSVSTYKLIRLYGKYTGMHAIGRYIIKESRRLK